ncbi:MAG TPA: hypothetical protein VGA75_02570, partial [Paracoccaceae bacterium]
AAFAAAEAADGSALGAAQAAARAAALDGAAKMINAGAMPEDRFETFGALFQKDMRAGFLALAARHPHRFRVIDGGRPPEVVAAEVLATTLAHLGPAHPDTA